MINLKKLTQSFIALSMTAMLSSSAGAAVLIENLQTSPVGAGGQFQPLTKVIVGAADVPITGFGVYGQAQFAGNLKWIIFDSLHQTSPSYLSPAQAVVGNPGDFANEAQWYDITNINFTLLAGHTYAMGVIADQIGSKSFRWGASPDNPSGPLPGIDANGLSLPFEQSLDNSGLKLGIFTDTPFIIHIDNTNRRQMSLRIFGPDTGEVPEPASIFLWSSLIAIGIVAGISRSRMHSTLRRINRQ
jgi:hypothetical protein